MTKLIKNISKISKLQKVVVWSLISLIIFSGLFYLYLTTTVVIETAMMNKNLAELKSLTKSYQQTEEMYFDEISKLTLDYALALGFEEQSERKFVSRGNVFAKR
ncbi:MAG: hypothetical protein COU71_02040 [Parcubacteria group bacterium CG10_big_fil_rev_8_21_14_0_10_38_31]|nr:MAG: hypothetical protein COU71_02040 [Parcubacteria group bacterium CG10_big_fil_rev_8_21_14_0_10_38_31]